MSSNVPPAPPQGQPGWGPPQGPPPQGWPQGQPWGPQQPQQDKKSIFKRWWFWVGAILLIAIIASAGSGSGGDADNAASTSDTTDQQPAADPAAEAPAAEEPAPPAEPASPEYAGKLKEDKVAQPGGEVMLSGWTVTASALESVSSDFGSDNLCSNVSMTNRDDEQQEYNGLSWKLQTPNGNVQDMTFTGENDLMTGGLAPGGNVSKRVCFEDQGAGPGQYILSWQPDIFSSEARGVWLNTL